MSDIAQVEFTVDRAIDIGRPVIDRSGIIDINIRYQFGDIGQVNFTIETINIATNGRPKVQLPGICRARPMRMPTGWPIGGRFNILETPPATTTLWIPDATAIIACRRATPPEAHAASTRVHGIGTNPA